MAYLPGVPDVGPAPGQSSLAQPSIAKSSFSGVGHGGTTGIGHLARSVGKPSRTEHLGTVVGRKGDGLTHITGGDPMQHMLNDYGKKASISGLAGADIIHPTHHAGAKVIKGQGGGIRPHVKEGGLGPGKFGRPGGSGNYSQADNIDTE